MIKRPLLGIGCTILIVTMVALFYPLPLWVPLLLLALTLAGCIVLDHKRLWLSFSIGAAAVLASVCTMGWQHHVQQQLHWANRTQELEGLVLDAQIQPGGTRYEVLLRLDSQTARVPLMCWDTERIEPGHMVRGTISLEQSAALYQEGRGIVLQGDTPALVDLGEGRSLRAFFLRIRGSLLSRMDTLFYGTGREILKSILLGERSELSPEVEDVFRMSGAYHILVVSGFHLSTIGGGIYLLLKLMRQNQRLTALLVIPFLLVLAAIEGAGISVVRATIMGGLFYLSKVVRRDYDALTAWSASLLVVLARPYAVKNIGFWMSYGAVLGIILFAPLVTKEIWRHIPIRKEHKKQWMKNIVAVVAASVCAQIFLIPIQLISFGSFSWMTIASSVVMLPLIFPVFVLAVGALLFSGIFVPAAHILARGAQLLCGVLYWILRMLAAGEPMLYDQGGWVIAWFLLLYAVLAVLYQRKSRRKTVLHALLCCALIFVGTAGWTASDRNEGTLLFACDHTLILVQDQRAAVVGTLDSSWDIDEAHRVLNGMGVERVEALCLSGSRGQSGVLAADFAGRWGTGSVTMDKPLDAFDFAGLPYTICSAGDRLHFWGDWELTLLEDGKGGIILENPKKKFLKLPQKYAIMTEMEPDYSAVFGEGNLVYGTDDLRWKKTRFGTLMAYLEE